MPTSHRLAGLLRLSLREMLILTALVALAVTSLTYANDVWLAIVCGLTMLIFFATLIIAVVDRGRRQAFAIGIALTMVAYGLILCTGQHTSGDNGNVVSKNVEFDQWQGRLPTTWLLRYVHSAVRRTREETITRTVFSPMGGSFGSKTVTNTYSREIPPREFFMPVGHCWWAIILGFAGGKFAQYVYARREQHATPEA